MAMMTLNRMRHCNIYNTNYYYGATTVALLHALLEDTVHALIMSEMKRSESWKIAVATAFIRQPGVPIVQRSSGSLVYQ